MVQEHAPTDLSYALAGTPTVNEPFTLILKHKEAVLVNANELWSHLVIRRSRSAKSAKNSLKIVRQRITGDGDLAIEFDAPETGKYVVSVSLSRQKGSCIEVDWNEYRIEVYP